MADEMSGKYLAANPSEHEKSRRLMVVRIFGGILISFGVFMALAFFCVLMRGVF
ncbi:MULTISPECIES: hypothetical protein [Streptomyces]|uniref:hypothetical protein n=1 Tax=Streptomyces TaxID=1883 RepID=UPI00131C3744|nr:MULTISPECIES: hypothetical protein [Streptomyces]QSS91412.1 hypothetical protein H3V39_13940 [Streptomyces sp. M54]